MLVSTECRFLPRDATKKPHNCSGSDVCLSVRHTFSLCRKSHTYQIFLFAPSGDHCTCICYSVLLVFSHQTLWQKYNEIKTLQDMHIVTTEH